MLLAAVLAAVCAVAAVFSATVPTDNVYYDLLNAENLFQDFITRYKKNYRTANERLKRFEIFKETLKKINEINSAYSSTKAGVTLFSDMTDDEFSMYKGYVPKNESEIVRVDPCLPAGILELPESFDWRDKGVVSPVKQQGSCMDCFIFSAVENIEGQYAIKHNECPSLSEQQVLDCNPEFSCDQGGFPIDVMNYLAQSGYGCEKESDYPYTGSKGSCAADKSKGLAMVQGGSNLNIQDEDALAQTLVQNGPLSIGIMADGLNSYVAGKIWKASDCSGEVNHGVLLVGFATDGTTPYWIIKNSWADTWGNQGYLFLEKGANACGILSGVTAAQVN